MVFFLIVYGLCAYTIPSENTSGRQVEEEVYEEDTSIQTHTDGVNDLDRQHKQNQRLF